MKISLDSKKSTAGTTRRVKTSCTLEPLTMGDRDFFFPSPLKLDVVLYVQEESIYMEGELHLTLGMECSRCLEEMTIDFCIPFSEEFQHHGEEVEEDFIDVTGRVLENIILEIPQKPLCQEECKGLCPHCGEERNKRECGCEEESIDPRLAVLEEYFKRE